MASTIIEQTRNFHEDIERLERAAVQFLTKDPKTNKERVVQEHLVRTSIDRIVDCRKQLADLYRDADGLRREEINSIAGPPNPNDTMVFSIFYDRLRDLKEYHRKFSIELPNPDNVLPDPQDIQVHFTGEETNGRYLDLHYLFDQYINLPGLKESRKRVEYLEYLSTFHKFDNSLEGEEYRTYIRDLIYYLVDWIHRSHPLFNVQEMLDEFDTEFERNWESGVHSWNNGESDEKSDGGEKSLYCEYCKRSFAKATVFDGHLKGKKHQQAYKQANAERIEGRKDLFKLEYRVHKLALLLEDVIDATKDNIVKKQSRLYSENAAEESEEEEEAVAEDDPADKPDEEDDEDEPVMRIRNYPTGWDGKPIPYWLYKLHGLGVEYKCEICGNQSYWGRRNFERHFQEWRHAYGMRCLKVPNTKHFQEITTMADAIALYKKIKEDSIRTAWRPEVEEEFEDADGNVYNRKTYEELQRQGII